MTRVGILQLETFQYLEARHGCEPDAHKWRMDHVALPVLSCSEKFRDCNLRAALIMDTSVASDTSSVFTKWPLAPKLCLRKNALQKLLESQGISYRTLAAIPAEATWDCKNRVCTSCLCFSGAVSRWRFIYMFDTCCILACHCDVVEPNSSWHCRLGKVFVAKGSALNAMYNTREAVGRSRLAQLPRSIWGHCPELGNKGVRISGNATSTSCDFLAYLWHHVASGVNTAMLCHPIPKRSTQRSRAAFWVCCSCLRVGLPWHNWRRQHRRWAAGWSKFADASSVKICQR